MALFLPQAPKPDRKKRRKKDTDIVSGIRVFVCWISVLIWNHLTLCLCLFQVEEHNGHIFKSTQYSIPTYCEYCSSLIWMMDKACVCKREFHVCIKVALNSIQHNPIDYQQALEQRTVWLCRAGCFPPSYNARGMLTLIEFILGGGAFLKKKKKNLFRQKWEWMRCLCLV